MSLLATFSRELISRNLVTHNKLHLHLIFYQPNSFVLLGWVGLAKDDGESLLNVDLVGGWSVDGMMNYISE